MTGNAVPQSYVTYELCQEGPSPTALSLVGFLGQADFEVGTGIQKVCSRELLGSVPLEGREGSRIEKKRKLRYSLLSTETSANLREFWRADDLPNLSLKLSEQEGWVCMPAVSNWVPAAWERRHDLGADLR